MKLLTLTKSKFSHPVKFASTLGLLSVLVFSTSTSTLAQPSQPASSPARSSTNLTVKRQYGICPQKVGLTTLLIPFEGGAEHTVVANTRAIAGSARVSSSGKKFVEYEAPLQKAYASCVGQATSPELRAYRVRLGNGKVYFRVDVGWVDGTTQITSRSLSAGLPYVRWIATE